MQQNMLPKEQEQQKKRPVIQRLAAGVMACLLALSATVNLVPSTFAEELEETIPTAIVEEVQEEQIPEEATEAVSLEVSEEVAEEVTEEVIEETPEEVTEEVAEEVTEEVIEETPEEVAEEVTEEVIEETPEEVAEEVTEEIPEIVPEYGEQPKGTAWLTSAGGYSASYPVNKVETKKPQSKNFLSLVLPRSNEATAHGENDQQIVSEGGANSAEGGKVNISKLISGTDIENVFDITLTVTTSIDVEEIMADPDMAVVLVMDMSATMMDDFSGKNGETTKYGVATSAAKEFVTTFAENTNGTSKLGFVTFNTYAYQACAMQPVASQAQVNSFNAAMTSNINNIVKTYQDSRNASGSITSNSRYTNIHAGLQKAKEMLDGVSSKNKFVVLLSDGLPTTYGSYVPMSSSGTVGADGVFHDAINRVYCAYGTNYSDKGATYAAGVANALKSSGVTIYSVGVGLNTFGSGHSKNGIEYIDEQLTRAKNTGVATVDTAGKTARSQLAVVQAGSFKNWLRTSIGSNHFIEGTAADLTMQYQEIFEDLKYISIINSADLWTVTDPLPEIFEFIAFHDQNGNLQSSLTGTLTSGGEDTAAIDAGTIIWNLKKSGYVRNGDQFTYSVPYRVRLKNEAAGFVEGNAYDTNGETYLTYNMIATGSDGSKVATDKTNLYVDVPSVEGYLAELQFTKVGMDGAVETPLAGATFTLTHAESCNVCRGDNVSAVNVAAMTATSAADGVVSFSNIPSGHTYILEETGVPSGYAGDSTVYTVTVAYDNVTVTANDTVVELEKVINNVLTVDTVIEGTKTLVNPNGKAHTYTFNLVEVDAEGNVLADGVTDTQTVTFAEGETINDKAFAFQKLIYKGSDLVDEQGNPVDSKTYYYKVSETEQDSVGLDADENYYIVEVVVALNEDKTAMSATQSILMFVAADDYAEEAANAITFTNTLLGDLAITKVVEPAEDTAAADQVFEILVMQNGEPLAAETEYTVDGEARYVAEGGIIALKAGETALFHQLTVGDTYTVEELETSAYGYTVSYSTEDGSVVIAEKTEEAPSTAITVTNTVQTVELALGGTKVISNPDGKKHTYEFQLQEVDAEGAPIGTPVTQSVETDGTGEFVFAQLVYQGTMLEGETSRIFYYEITELTASDLTVIADPAVYTVTVELKSEEGQLTAEITGIQKAVNDTVADAESVTFTNTLLGTLTVTKKIIGDYPEDETFAFTIFGLTDGTYYATLNGAACTVNVTNGVFSINLTHKDSLVIHGIPHGTNVTVTEAESEYTVRYVVNSGWQKDGNSVTAKVSTDGTEILFKNYSPYGLPQTGLLYWPIPILAILGLSCMSIGVYMMTRKKDRYEV